MGELEKGNANGKNKEQLSGRELIESIKDQWSKIESDILAGEKRVSRLFLKDDNPNQKIEISTTLKIQLERMWVKVPDNFINTAQWLFDLVQKTLKDQLASEIKEIDREKQQAIESVLLQTHVELKSLKTGTLIAVLNLLHENKDDACRIGVDNKIHLPLINTLPTTLSGY